jgi:murein DD-endopeptidase MepM/ murein hydrolase activator NlpD
VSEPYSWPLEPFDCRHPARAFFGDPRIGGGGGSSFHDGVDISAPDGTPVYAVAPGCVSLGGPQIVVVVTPGRSFGYWHVVPAVRSGAQVRVHGLLGQRALRLRRRD